MAETIECVPGSKPKWHWDNVMGDLEKQGGLQGVVIDPFSVGDHRCGGKTEKDTKFHITWVKDTFLLVSVSQEEQALIDAFTKIVEYKPFCRYVSIKSGLLTFEWDKKDPESRFDALKNDKNVKDLQKIN